MGSRPKTPLELHRYDLGGKRSDTLEGLAQGPRRNAVRETWKKLKGGYGLVVWWDSQSSHLDSESR